MYKTNRPRYNPTWQLLDDNNSVIWALSEASLSDKNIVITPDLPRSRQHQLALEMEVGEVVICRVLVMAHGIRHSSWTQLRLKRIA